MLASILPPPRQTYSRAVDGNNISSNPWANSAEGGVVVATNVRIPPYGQRESYVPRDPEDFGDGGAFPEIHIKQYPLDMGRPDRKKNTSGGGVVALRVDVDGQVRYDAVLRQGMRNDQIMHSRYEDMVPKDNLTQEDLAKPDEEATNEGTQDTRQALEMAIMSRLTANRPRGTQGGEGAGAGPTYIRYTPGKQEQEYNSGAKSRMIKLYEMQEDPLEPPKYRHRKLPNRPPSPPVPVMHSPPRPVTQEDQKNWKIPPCVSSWKNARGYTLALHQRLAADGRSLQNHAINDKFAKLTESLHMAERQARHEVEERAKMRLLLGKKKKQEMEKELANIAKAAKQTFQSGMVASGKNEKRERSKSEENDTQDKEKQRDVHEYDREKEERARQEREREKEREKKHRRGEDDDDTEGLTEEQIRGREERDKIRKERARERKREFRMEQSKGKNTRQRERDITEKIALGQVNAKKTGDSLYDSRLFNQESGLGSGFEVDDTYNLYDKPLFNSVAKKIYRPKHMDLEVYGGEDEQQDVDKLLEQSSKFKPHKAFEGAENSQGRRTAGGPVEFVKAEIEADDVNYSKNLQPGLQENKKKVVPKEEELELTEDREREKEDKERTNNEERKRDRHEKDRDVNRERNTDRDRDRNRDRDRDRNRDRDRDRDRDRNRDRDRDRDRNEDHERHKDRSNHTEHHRSRDDDRDRHRHKDRDREHERRRGEHTKEHHRRRSRSHSRERSRGGRHRR